DLRAIDGQDARLRSRNVCFILHRAVGMTNGDGVVFQGRLRDCFIIGSPVIEVTNLDGHPFEKREPRKGKSSYTAQSLKKSPRKKPQTLVDAQAGQEEKVQGKH